MKRTITQRIKEYAIYKGISIRAFERECGLSNGYVNSIEGSIGPNKLSTISLHYPDLNRDWLLYGEGEMLNAASATTTVAKERTEKGFRTHFKEDNVTMVPLLNVDSVGGLHSQNDISAYDEQYIMGMIPFKNALPDDIAIRETGNSMSPKIPAGAILLLRQVVDWREYFGYGHEYVLVLRDGRRITKRVTKCIDNPKEYVLCESINPEYPSEELPRKMIFAVWKVIGVLINEGY